MNCIKSIINSVIILLSLLCIYDCLKIDLEKKKYYLVSEAYNVSKNLFNQGRYNYNQLKAKSLDVIDTFLDLVGIVNEEMAGELRSAVVKFYKVKYFHGFTNYIISMEEMINITEHCLIEPLEKLKQIRIQFNSVIQNFWDIRNFDTVDKCMEELPDEVAAAHCILHQAVLYNETMHETLVTIVEIKTRQHAQDMNTSIYSVQKCLYDFVPKFFEQLLVDAYTNKCGYLKIVNASITDLINDKWRDYKPVFPEKWTPVVKLLRERKKSHLQLSKEPLFLTLLKANLTSPDIAKTLTRRE